MPKVVKGHVAFEPRRHVYSLQDAVCYVLLEIDQELKYHEVLEKHEKRWCANWILAALAL